MSSNQQYIRRRSRRLSIFVASEADRFYRLYGDVNGDGFTDFVDFVDFVDFANRFLPAFGTGMGSARDADELVSIRSRPPSVRDNQSKNRMLQPSG